MECPCFNRDPGQRGKTPHQKSSLILFRSYKARGIAKKTETKEMLEKQNKQKGNSREVHI